MTQVVLITGAAKRVGAAIARKLHGEGMNVVVHYRGAEQEAKTLRDELEGIRADSVELVQADLTEVGVAEGLVERALSRWGRLDGVVNNASSFFPTRIGEVTEEAWNDLMRVNLTTPFFLIQAASAHLVAAEGWVVSIVDIYADRPLKGFPVYSIAKAGLAMMTKAYARELGPDVRVNAIAPGVILWPESGTSDKTRATILKRTALKREGEPADIANAVLYLSRASYVTGHILTVDGGRTLTN